MKHTRNSIQSTIDTGNTLIDKMKDDKKKSWEEVITSTDLTHMEEGMADYQKAIERPYHSESTMSSKC